MPAKSTAQQKFMAICSHDPSKARGKCPPHNVAEEFSHKGPDMKQGHMDSSGSRNKGACHGQTCK